MQEKEKNSQKPKLQLVTDLPLEVQAVEHFLQSQHLLAHQGIVLVTLICGGKESRLRVSPRPWSLPSSGAGAQGGL